MPVRLRLARHGTRNNPFYHVVAIADHKPRDARPIEKLGEYDPIPRRVLARPAPAWAPHMGTLATSNRLPIDAIIGGKGKGKAKGDPYDTAGQVIGSGIAQEDDFRLEKRLEWNTKRIQYWLSVGAQPSKPVARMLDKAGLLPHGKFFSGVWKPLSALDGSKADPAQLKPNKHEKDVTGDSKLPSSASSLSASMGAESKKDGARLAQAA